MEPLGGAPGTLYVSERHYSRRAQERRVPLGDRPEGIPIAVHEPHIAPTKPGEKSYAQMVEVMTDHNNPALSEIVQCYINSIPLPWKGTGGVLIQCCMIPTTLA